MRNQTGLFEAPMKFLTTLLSIVLVTSVTPRALAVTNFYVDNASSACSDAGAGTQAQPYCTITAAINAHKGAGVAILVKPGTYREQVTVPASGAAGDTFFVRALGGPVVIDGADDFSATGPWTLVSGNVWVASSVTFSTSQAFMDGVRLTASTASPASTPANH